MAPKKKIVPVSAEDSARLSAIADMHLELLSFGPMSPFGKEFVRAVGYELPMRDGSMRLACMEIDGDIVGFIAFADDARHFYASALKGHFFKTSWLTLRSLVSKPSRVRALLRAMRFARERSSGEGITAGTAEITAIAVRPDYSGGEFVRRTGIRVSHELVGHARSETGRRGAKWLRGVIDGFNKPAVMMFGQLGAEITSVEQAGEPMYVIMLPANGL